MIPVILFLNNPNSNPRFVVVVFSHVRSGVRNVVGAEPIAAWPLNMNKNNFKWTSDFVFSANKEKIVDIDGSGNSNYANLWILGQPLQVYWGFQADGIFQYSDTVGGKGILASYYWPKNGRTNVNYQPGRIRISDGDSAYSPADRVILGSHNPDFIASFGNTLTYKNFDLNFLIYFRVGGLYRVPRPGLVGRYQSNKVNYWTPSNPSNEYQQPTQTSDVCYPIPMMMPG